MPNKGNYPNFGGFSQTFGVDAKILGFYTLGTHYSWGYPNFDEFTQNVLFRRIGFNMKQEVITAVVLDTFWLQAIVQFFLDSRAAEDMVLISPKHDSYF